MKATSNPDTQFYLHADNSAVSFDIAASSSSAAASGDGPTKTPRFRVVGYTGGKMNIAGWPEPVVVDLAGMEIRQQKPVYFQHGGDLESLLGQTDSIRIVDNTLIAEGLMFDESETARRVIALAKKGFKWQASVGAKPRETVRLMEGERAKVNGRTVEGPVIVVTKSTLGEISFVMLGADEETSVKIAQIAAKNTVKESTMKNKANSQTPPSQAAAAETAEGKETATAAAEPQKTIEAQAATTAAAVTASTEPSVAPASAAEQVAQIRAAAATEVQRIADIAKACNGAHPDIQAKAVQEGWNVTRTELEVLRASRPAVPNFNIPQVDNFAQVLEAAAIMAGGIRGESLLKAYGEKTVEAADRRFRGRIGLQQLLMEAARQNGCPVMYFHDDMRRVLQAAFSTFDVSGILSNIANKFLLEGYMSVEQVWREIAATGQVKDFKEITSYRMSGAFQFDEVGPDGELKHGEVGEEAYTNKAKTFGKMFSVTRTDLINDDLGALTALPKRIGRGGHLKLNLVFWTEFMNNADFFKADNKNYQEGADTALSIDALTKAELLFLDQTDKDGAPMATTPRTLLVPNALKVPARQFCHDLELRDTTVSKKYTTANPHAGKWTPLASAYLGNPTIPGYSILAWYLLADKNDVPVIEVVFLNGVENPTVESADADFNTLGIQMRGYFDFGVKKQDPKGGVKSKGAA